MNATRLTIKRLSGACLLLSTVLLSVLLTGCGTRRKASPIEDVGNLEGRRVGVEIACDTDYALTGRSDLKVVRYDSLPGILLALQYDKVDVMALDDLGAKYRAFGWDTQTCDGNDMAALINYFHSPKTEGKPHCLIARTVKGKGLPFAENQAAWHHKVPNDGQLAEAYEALGVKGASFK